MRTPALPELLGRLHTASASLAPNALGRLPNPGLTLEAVLHDFWQGRFGAVPDSRVLKSLLGLYTTPELASALLLSLWLLQAPALREVIISLGPKGLEAVLLDSLPELLAALNPRELFSQPERQEELVRFWLRELGVQPLHESPADSHERWELISSQRRRELFALLRSRRRRERAVREAQSRRQQDW